MWDDWIGESILCTCEIEDVAFAVLEVHLEDRMFRGAFQQRFAVGIERNCFARHVLECNMHYYHVCDDACNIRVSL